MPNVKGNNRSVLTISCIWFLSILLLPTVGLGQTTSGTFVGTVTDTTGAVDLPPVIVPTRMLVQR